MGTLINTPHIKAVFFRARLGGGGDIGVDMAVNLVKQKYLLIETGSLIFQETIQTGRSIF